MLIRLQADGGFVSLIGGGLGHPRLLVAEPLIDLGRRYAVAREGANAGEQLLQIDRDLYTWLDGADGWLAELLPKLTPPFLLEIEAPPQPSAPEWAVLQAPWV